MKCMLFALLLLPAASYAQKIELSLSGGIVNNNLFHYKRPGSGSMGVTNDMKKPVCPGGGISASIDVYKGVRVGLSLSAYQIKGGFESRNQYYNQVFSQHESYGSPAIPLELTIIKRMNIGKVNIDMGIVGGVVMNGKYTFINGSETATITPSFARDKWFTLGTVVSAQLPVTKNFSLGAEVQYKRMKTDHTFITLVPVMLKVSFHLGK